MNKLLLLVAVLSACHAKDSDKAAPAKAVEAADPWAKTWPLAVTVKIWVPGGTWGRAVPAMLPPPRSSQGREIESAPTDTFTSVTPTVLQSSPPFMVQVRITEPVSSPRRNQQPAPSAARHSEAPRARDTNPPHPRECRAPWVDGEPPAASDAPPWLPR